MELCASAFDTVVRDVSSAQDISYWENLANYLTGDATFAREHAHYLHKKHTPLRQRRWCYRLLLLTIVAYMYASTLAMSPGCNMHGLTSRPFVHFAKTMCDAESSSVRHMES